MYYLKTDQGTDKIENFRHLKQREEQLRELRKNYIIIYPDWYKVHCDVLK